MGQNARIMSIAYVFIAIFVFGMLIDFRKTIAILAPFHLILALIPFEKLPVSDFEVVSVIALCFYLVKRPFSQWTSLIRNPFNVGICLTLISIVGTNYFIEPHWPTSILRFISAFIYPMILWNCIDEKSMLQFVVKTTTAFALVMSLYILIEVILGTNPFIQMALTNKWVNEDLVIDYEEIRFGFKRCQGFLATPAASGLFLGLFGVVLYCVAPVLEEKKRYMAILVGLFLACTILSGTRSVIAASVVAALIIVRKEFFNAKLFLFKLVLVMVIIAVGGSFFLQIIDSFINSENVQGSSGEMRMNQLMVTLIYWARSPIWGNGNGFVWTFVKEVDVDIAGAESIWFQVLLDQGLVGAIAYLGVNLNAAIAVLKKNKIWVFVPLGFLVGKTLSSVLGIELSLLFVLTIILLKYDELYVKEKDTQDKETLVKNADDEDDA